MFRIHKKYKPLYKEGSRYFVVTGGRGSGKSFSITTLLLFLTYQENEVILFTRYTMTSAHISIIPEFLDKIESAGLQDHFKINKDEIVNNLTGSKILFRGIKTSAGNQTANLKSLNGVTCFLIDEAEELTDEKIFDKINLSVRQQGKQNRVILILNPTTKEHWIYKKFFEGVGVQEGSNLTKGNTTYIHTSYLDNTKNLDESFIEEVEKLKDSNPIKYKHQIEGGWLDKAEGVIFTNWRIGDFDNNLIYYFGQDFGFSVDPTTLIRVAIDKDRKKLFLKEEFYEHGLTTSEIASKNIIHAGKSLIIADSAEPRLITEVKSKGVNIKAVSKYPGSIVTGIGLMQDYEIIIDPDSLNLIKEFNNYIWQDKKSNTPIDDWNHGIDPVRYVMMEIVGKKSTPVNRKFR